MSSWQRAEFESLNTFITISLVFVFLFFLSIKITVYLMQQRYNKNQYRNTVALFFLNEDFSSSVAIYFQGTKPKSEDNT
jgi:hypothetical protein